MIKRRRTDRRPSLEFLEPRHMLAASFVINEFMADNDRTLIDGNGDSPDWIEIYNDGDQVGNLEGWFLTDRADDLTKWKLPSAELAPDDYLVVFASGREDDARDDVAGNLHANFRLDRDGEYVALVQPDGQTVASEYAANGQDHPQQFENVSYGTARRANVTKLIRAEDEGRILIPKDDSLGLEWTSAAFADESWAIGTASIGFVEAIEDLRFWLKADHISDLQSGDSVVTWPDSSGEGHTAIHSNSRSQPTWIDNVLGQRAVVRFDGIDDALDVDSLHIGKHATVFFVARNAAQSSAVNSPHYLLTASNDADRDDGNGYGFGYGSGKSPGFSVVQGQGENGLSNQTIVHRTSTNEAFEIISYRKASSLAELWRDGTLVASGAQLDPTGGYTSGYSIGSSQLANGHHYRGDIAEIIVFDRALSNDEFSAITSYLEETYSLAGHSQKPKLVSYWNFDDRTISDQIGSVHGVELKNGATFSADVGAAGGSHSLDLTHGKDYVTLPPVDYGITNEYTIASWVKRDGTGTGRFFAAKRDLTSGGSDRSGIALGLNGNKVYAGLISSDGDDVSNTRDTFHDYSTTRLTVPPNEWTHVAVTLKDDLITLYVNGEAETVYNSGGGAGHADGRLKVSGRTIDFVDSDGSFSGFGADGSSPADASSAGDFTRSFFDGWLDEVAVWNTALTPSSVALLAQGQSPPSIAIGRADLPSIAPADMDAARMEGMIKTDVRDQMQGPGDAGLSASAYLRIPFELDDPNGFDSLDLRIRYDDGFVAYLNGTEIARRNVDEPASWNSAAITERPRSQAVNVEQIDVSRHLDSLTAGSNVLAIHGLNSSPDDPDFLIGVELVDVQMVDDGPRYFVVPTPGARNGSGINNSGPIINEVSHTPSRPSTSQNLIISAKIATRGESQLLQSATLTYRVMYGEQQSLTMVDDGTGPDATAGDGIYTASIPADTYQEGDMVRYFISTLDTIGNPARKPEFLLPTRSAQYFGTVVIDPSVPETKLPVLEWFVEDPNWYRVGARNSREYIFASLYYDEQFYDNIRVRVRGGVTQDQAKPNFKFDFYSGGRFQFEADQPSVEEINLQSLMGELTTRTYMRNPLAYQLFRESGHVAPLSFYTHVRQNGDFYGLVALEEQIDETFLEKHGFDPDGALYKASSGAMLQTDPTSGQWDKATRLDEDFSDLAAFAEGLANSDPSERARFVFDNVNIPQVIHYLAVSLLGPHHDRLTHNYYVYRDTDGTGEWSIFPWDMDRFFPQADLLTNPTATPVFYGDSDHPRWPGTPTTRYNRLNDAIYDIPETREMFVTHLRSVVERWMNSSYLEDSVDAITDLIELDAELDNRKWRLGRLSAGVRAIKNTFGTRRRQLANDPDFRNPGVTYVSSGSPASILVPTSDELGARWTTTDFVQGEAGETWEAGTLSIGFDRGTALDDLIDTDIEEQMHDRQKSVFLRSVFQYDGAALDSLVLRMHYDDAFVAYLNGTEVARSDNLDPGTPSINANVSRGHNSKVPEDIDISEFQEQLVVGDNVLAIHGLNVAVDNRDVFILPHLIAVESADLSTIDIAFDEIDSTPNSGNQDEEYITLVNKEAAAVDISGWRLAGGVSHEFQPGTVISARGKLYVSPNVEAFRNRALGPSGGQSLFVQGNYSGHISSRGETIELLDLAGEKIASVDTPAAPSDVQNYLRVTELHYNPASDDQSTEFIEFRNVSDSVTLDLNNVRITDGPRETFDFTGSEVTSLGPRQFALVVKDLGSFTTTYPRIDEGIIAGAYQGSLSNAGETVKIEDADNGTVLEFRYEDGRDTGEEQWHTATDGEGYSLVIVNENAVPDSWSNGSAWRRSAAPGGSPGAKDVAIANADFNGDGKVTTVDIDLLTSGIRTGDDRLDLTNDGATDRHDLRFMIENVLMTTFGDSNLDGFFNTLDIVAVLQSAEYEDETDGNSGWAEGDWNGDGDFDKLDLVFALQNSEFVP